MNRKMVFNITGRILTAEAIMLLLPITVGVIYGETETAAYVQAALAALIAGFTLSLAFKPKTKVIYAGEGFVIVALSWILMSVVGALPFIITGEIPDFASAFFETVSGFTTTGASVVDNVEALCHATLIWRAFTHWIGGMGVLVFVMAVVPGVSERSIHLLRAEVPGPTVGKLVPKLKDTAKILYLIYIGITVAEIILLSFGDMTFFESVFHAFGTAGTGGFGMRNGGLSAYGAYSQWVVTVFMLIFGVNFNLYYFILIGKAKTALKSHELWLYLGIVVAATAVITFNVRGLYDSFSELIRASSFQVASIITTTGFATADFNQWPELSRGIIFVLLFVGGCAGSTAGGFKISRIMMLVKSAKRELTRAIHPRSVGTVRHEGKPVDATTLSSAGNYLLLYVAGIAITFLLISFEPFGFESNLTAAVSVFNNVGPGLGAVGPMGGYGGYTAFSKIVMSFAMLLGRLEIYPIIIAFMPATWKRK